MCWASVTQVLRSSSIWGPCLVISSWIITEMAAILCWVNMLTVHIFHTMNSVCKSLSLMIVLNDCPFHFPCCLITSGYEFDWRLQPSCRWLSSAQSHSVCTHSAQFTEYCSIFTQISSSLSAVVSAPWSTERLVVWGLCISKVVNILTRRPNTIAYNARDGRGTIHRLLQHALARSEKIFTWYNMSK